MKNVNCSQNEGIAGDGGRMADLNWPPHTSYRSLSCAHVQQIQSNLAMIYLHGIFISDNKLDFQVLHRG